MMHWMWKKSMKLHQNQQDFEELIELTAQWKHIPSDAVRKDYFITFIALLPSGERAVYRRSACQLDLTWRKW